MHFIVKWTSAKGRKNGEDQIWLYLQHKENGNSEMSRCRQTERSQDKLKFRNILPFSKTFHGAFTEIALFQIEQ